MVLIGMETAGQTTKDIEENTIRHIVMQTIQLILAEKIIGKMALINLICRMNHQMDMTLLLRLSKLMDLGKNKLHKSLVNHLNFTMVLRDMMPMGHTKLIVNTRILLIGMLVHINKMELSGVKPLNTVMA